MNKILLIDDDRDFMNLLAIIAGDYGWEPYKAASMQEARKLLTQDNYHTVCIDFSLRDGTAIDVLGFMKDRGIGGRAVILSGHSEDSIRSAALQAGAMEYVEKGGMGFPEAIFAISKE